VAYAKSGDYERAIADLQKVVKLSGGNPGALAGLACAQALAGRRGEASAILARLDSTARRDYVAPSTFAFVLASLGEKDKALEWLQKAHDGHDNVMAGLGVEPWLEPLHGDPRFEALLLSVNLPLPRSQPAPALRRRQAAAKNGRRGRLLPAAEHSRGRTGRAAPRT
jgi:tetratricopeptide (TPR) repeat protein